MGYDAFSSRKSAVNNSAPLQKREQIERAGESFLKKVEDSEEYDMLWWRTCGKTDWLKTSGVKGRDDKAEW